MITEIPNPQGETGIIEQESTLAGKRALITGASRDIGAAIAISLAREGVDVMGVYRDPAKKKRADATKKIIEEAGGSVELFQADVTTEAGMLMVEGALGDEELDFLVLSASGKDDRINVEAAQNLIDLSVPRIRRGGAIVLMQSIPGHFVSQLDDPINQAEFYEPIAISKRKGEDQLRAQIPNLEEKGIKVFVVCPPMVDGSSNVRLFKMIDKEAEQKNNAVSRKLGLPENVPMDYVGEQIANLLRHREEYPTGYTEFGNGMLDIRTLLGRWYDSPRTYIDTAIRTTDTGELREGIAYTIVSGEQAERQGEPEKFLDGVKFDSEQNSYGSFTPAPEHAQGHFTDASGLPKIYPGHKQIRTAAEYAILLMKNLPGNEEKNFRLAGAKGVEFKNPVIANSSTEMQIHALAQTQQEGIETSANFEMSTQTPDGKGVSSMSELTVAQYEDTEGRMQPDQLIEAMAQAAGSIGLDFDPEKFPLFGGIREITFTGSMPRRGDGLTFAVQVMPQGKRGFDKFEANVVVVNGDQIIATATGIQASLFPKSFIEKRLR